MIRAARPCLALAAAAARSCPDPRATDDADCAGILDAAVAARIAALLGAARDDPGVEMTVVTIGSVADHAPGLTLEGCATGPFNRPEHRPARDKQRDSPPRRGRRPGRAHRTRRRHPPVREGRALRVIEMMLRRFRDGDMAGGIEAGLTGAVEHIARTLRAGDSSAGGRASGRW